MQKSCCIDIDGVLNYYPRPWLHFLKTRGHSFNKLIKAKKGLSYEDYVCLKKAYRKSEEKRFQPPRIGSVEFTEKLREKGYIIILKTSRPIDEHPHLIDWTYEWLNEHCFMFDEVVFNRFHVPQILSSHPDLEFMVDDDAEMIAIMNGLGVKTFLFNGDFNQILRVIK